MSGKHELLEGIVLDRLETGETHLRISLYSPNVGLRLALLRLRKGNLSHPPPDIFDDVEVSMNRRVDSNSISFIKDFQILNKRTALACSHRCFYYASKVARLFLDNGSLIQDTVPTYKLIISSMEAFQKGLRPDLVWIKTLFRLGRAEGFAVKEDWLSNLKKREQEFAFNVLSKKVNMQNPSPSSVKELTQSLSVWLDSETELNCKV
jgi:recombinational DNA repair protein (RecF pathway)